MPSTAEKWNEAYGLWRQIKDAAVALEDLNPPFELDKDKIGMVIGTFARQLEDMQDKGRDLKRILDGAEPTFFEGDLRPRYDAALEDAGQLNSTINSSYYMVDSFKEDLDKLNFQAEDSSSEAESLQDRAKGYVRDVAKLRCAGLDGLEKKVTIKVTKKRR